MSLHTAPWPAGVPCWVDLTSPDLATSKAFYADVLGWDYQDLGEQYGGYHLATVRGADVAGLGPQQPGAGPSAWSLYLASDDADATAEAVTRHGGTVLRPPADVGPLGRMFLAADSTGAAFGVWQAGEHVGAGLVNEPGGLAWEDLRSPDPDAAREFYAAVFGYRTTPLPGAGADYTTFSLAGEEAPLGGMGGMMGSDAPAHWLVYFGVADADAAAAASTRGGGAVNQPAFDTPYGRMAGLADPHGAAFSVVVIPAQAAEQAG